MTMGTPAKFNEYNHAEEPARVLLERLGWTYVPREVLAMERSDERDVLLKWRLRMALLRLNQWMTEEQARRIVFELENVNSTGMARNQAVHEYLTYGMPLTVDGPRGRDSRTVRFFDFDHPEGGLNEFLVTTQLRVRRGNEPGGQENDERMVIPDLVLFVNGVPLVVMEAKSPSLLDVWKSNAVRQLRRYQEAGPGWQGGGAPELFHYNLMCVAHCGAAAVYAAPGAPENAYFEWKSVMPYSEDEVRHRFGVEPQGQAQLIAGLLSPAILLDVLRDYVVYEPERGRLVKKLPRYQQYRAVHATRERTVNGRGTAEQWIKEGKYALNWTRLSCHRFVANRVRLSLFVLAYNLGNFLRRLCLPKAVKHWSLRSVQVKLIKMGGRLVRHSRRLIFQLAEVSVPRRLFQGVLDRIGRLSPAPS